MKFIEWFNFIIFPISHILPSQSNFIELFDIRPLRKRRCPTANLPSFLYSSSFEFDALTGLAKIIRQHGLSQRVRIPVKINYEQERENTQL